MDSRIPGYYDGVARSYDDAISILNNMTDWTDGWLYSIKYMIEPDVINDVDNIGIIVAIGIKDSSSCGVAGRSNPNLWLDRSINHGPQFYKILNIPPQSREQSNGVDIRFHTTTVNMNGKQYAVLNSDEKDYEVSDPFEIECIYPVGKNYGTDVSQDTI